MRYFWTGWLKTSVAFIIVADSIFDIPLLAKGPTRGAIFLHAALKSVANERSVVPQSSRASVAQPCSNAVRVTNWQTTMLAGMSGKQMSTRGAMIYCRCLAVTDVQVRGASSLYLFRLALRW
jgi:hypothetical protein